MNCLPIPHRFAVVSPILMLSVGAGNTTVLAQPTTEHAPAESGDAGIADPAEATGEPEIANPRQNRRRNQWHSQPLSDHFSLRHHGQGDAGSGGGTILDQPLSTEPYGSCETDHCVRLLVC